MNPNNLQNICQIGILVFAIFSGLCVYGSYYFGKKAENLSNSENQQIQKEFVKEAKDDRQEKHDNLSSKMERNNQVLENIDKRIDEIGSNTYSPLSSILQKTINKNLTSLAEEYGTNKKFIIEIESGNNNRHKVASDLGSLLTVIKLGNYPLDNTSMGRFPGHAITIFSSSENTRFVSDFIIAIKPYLTAEIFIDTSFKSPEFIKIYINGNPIFYADGRVEIQ